MKNKLEPILLQKQLEVRDLYLCIKEDGNHPIGKILQGILPTTSAFNFKKALSSTSLSVIAEIKRKSPSKGMISSILDPVQLANRYISGGAGALSILTDQKFFAGHLNDLIQVAKQVPEIPILRKDFIIDKIQIAEAYLSGASAVLCIVSVLGKKTKEFIEFSHKLNLDVLVEVHDEAELKLGLDCGADIIGINNRNLSTFEVDSQRALQLISAIPDKVIKVAESGVTHPTMARQYYEAGFNAVLVGEALVRAANPEQFIQECHCA